MRLEIRIRNIKCDDALRAYIRRRIGFALGRLSLSIRRVTISVNAGDGVRGGLGSECRLTMRLIRTGSVVLIERAPDVDSLHSGGRDSREGSR